MGTLGVIGASLIFVPLMLRFVHRGGPRGPMIFTFELICVIGGMALVFLEWRKTARQGQQTAGTVLMICAVIVGFLVGATGLGSLFSRRGGRPEAPGVDAGRRTAAPGVDAGRRMGAAPDARSPSRPTIRDRSDPQFYEANLADLKDSDPRRRRDAVLRIKGAEPKALREEITEALEALMRDQDWVTRAEAIRAWRRWHTPERSAAAVDRLIALLADEHYGVQDLASEALAEIDDERVAPALTERLTSIRTRYSASRWLRQMGPRAEQAVMRYLRHEEASVRREALSILKQIATEESVPGLIEILEADDFSARSTATEICGRLRSEQAAGPVAALLCSSVDRRQAAECLKAIGSAAESAVAAYLKHEDPMVAHEAALILAEIASEKSVPQLIEALDYPGPLVRHDAIKALAHTKDERAMEALAALLSTSDASYAARALKEPGPAAEEAILKRLTLEDPNVVAECCGILETIGTKKSLTPLSRLADSSDSRVRSASEKAERAILAREAREGPAPESAPTGATKDN